jgi:hypothetical protein
MAELVIVVIAPCQPAGVHEHVDAALRRDDRGARRFVAAFVETKPELELVLRGSRVLARLLIVRSCCSSARR